MHRLLFLLLVPALGHAQNFQFHEDFRHTVDPAYNDRNDPTLYFEYFHPADTGRSRLGPCYMKIQCDLLGPKDNMGKSFFQASQSFRVWKPPVYLAVQYSGGLGVTQPPQYSYTISNAFSVGPSWPFRRWGAWFNLMVTYTYNALPHPSQDVLVSFYWGKALRNYTWEFNGDFEVYTIDKTPQGLPGKWICFFGEPQIWRHLARHLSLGSRLNLFYHVLTFQDHFQAYPTLGVKYTPN